MRHNIPTALVSQEDDWETILSLMAQKSVNCKEGDYIVPEFSVGYGDKGSDSDNDS